MVNRSSSFHQIKQLDEEPRVRVTKTISATGYIFFPIFCKYQDIFIC